MSASALLAALGAAPSVRAAAAPGPGGAGEGATGFSALLSLGGETAGAPSIPASRAGPASIPQTAAARPGGPAAASAAPDEATAADLAPVVTSSAAAPPSVVTISPRAVVAPDTAKDVAGATPTPTTFDAASTTADPGQDAGELQARPVSTPAPGWVASGPVIANATPGASAWSAAAGMTPGVATRAPASTDASVLALNAAAGASLVTKTPGGVTPEAASPEGRAASTTAAQASPPGAQGHLAGFAASSPETEGARGQSAPVVEFASQPAAIARSSTGAESPAAGFAAQARTAPSAPGVAPPVVVSQGDGSGIARTPATRAPTIASPPVDAASGQVAATSAAETTVGKAATAAPPVAPSPVASSTVSPALAGLSLGAARISAGEASRTPAWAASSDRSSTQTSPLTGASAAAAPAIGPAAAAPAPAPSSAAPLPPPVAGPLSGQNAPVGILTSAAPGDAAVAGSTTSATATTQAAQGAPVLASTATVPMAATTTASPPTPEPVVYLTLEPTLEPAADAQAVEVAERAAAAASASASAGMASSLSRASVETTALLAARMLNRLDQRVTRFDMALTPEGLGRVDVSMDIEKDGQLVARLAFDSPAAAAEMRGRADELRRQLETAGFTLAEDALEFSERREGNPSPFEDRRSGAGRAFRDGDRLAAEADLAPPVWISLKPTRDGVDVKV